MICKKATSIYVSFIFGHIAFAIEEKTNCLFFSNLSNVFVVVANSQ
jgi:hypothetical protein